MGSYKAQPMGKMSGNSTMAVFVLFDCRWVYGSFFALGGAEAVLFYGKGPLHDGPVVLAYAHRFIVDGYILWHMDSPNCSVCLASPLAPFWAHSRSFRGPAWHAHARVQTNMFRGFYARLVPEWLM